MYSNLSLDGKIQFCEMQIKSLQDSLQFWNSKQEEYRTKYGSSPNKFECQHIHACKQHYKKAKADLEYWQAELAKLIQKKQVYILFS